MFKDSYDYELKTSEIVVAKRFNKVIEMSIHVFIEVTVSSTGYLNLDQLPTSVRESAVRIK